MPSALHRLHPTGRAAPAVSLGAHEAPHLLEMLPKPAAAGSGFNPGVHSSTKPRPGRSAPGLLRRSTMKIKAANGVARILKVEGIPWVSCFPTNHVNNALGEEGVRILMMGEERFAVAVADAFSRVTCGKRIGVCTVMSNLNAAGIQMAYGAIGQAWEDSSPILVITEGVGQGASRHTHFDMAEAL